MRVLAVLAAVAVADATMSLDSTNDFRRALQAHGRGVADTDICGHSTAAITARVGTLHDDQTDETIDCSQGGCGGLDAGHNGYSDNLDCTKTITGGANQVVSLVFTHFNLEMCATVTSCDYIEVFDGASASSPSLGQFSGPNLPSVIRSTGNSVTVHFHTDGGNAQISGTDDPGCARPRSPLSRTAHTRSRLPPAHPRASCARNAADRAHRSTWQILPRLALHRGAEQPGHLRRPGHHLGLLRR